MGNKGWSILFGAVNLGCFLGFAAAPIYWWMPTGMSSHSDRVDWLFMMILYITAFFFVLTEGLMAYFLWKYASDSGKRPVPGHAEYPKFIKPLTGILREQHHVELAWTVLPAAILLFIAFVQVETWADIKYESRRSHSESEKASLQVALSARQFEWRFRYPSHARFEKWLKDKSASKPDFDSFARIPQSDDVHVVNELHLWQDHQVVVYLTTRDVIHSFNLPNFRVKQDALPGKMIPVWFKTIDSEKTKVKSFNCKFDDAKKRYVDGINPDTGKDDTHFIYDIPCAELCGWGHYRMIGRVYVHKDEGDFLNWLKLADENNSKRTSDR